jgi:hypothetical protein
VRIWNLIWWEWWTTETITGEQTAKFFGCLCWWIIECLFMFFKNNKAVILWSNDVLITLLCRNIFMGNYNIMKFHKHQISWISYKNIENQQNVNSWTCIEINLCNVLARNSSTRRKTWQTCAALLVTSVGHSSQLLQQMLLNYDYVCVCVLCAFMYMCSRPTWIKLCQKTN